MQGQESLKDSCFLFSVDPFFLKQTGEGGNSMSMRENRRLKEKRTMIPFGDIMLPVIGLVAIGLLIVGVKLFFLTEPKIPGYRPTPPDANPGRVEVQAPSPAPAAKEAKPAAADSLLAAPVGGGGSAGGRPAQAAARPSAPPQARPSEPRADSPPQKTPKPQPPSQPEPQQKPQPKPAPSANSKWGVQIGSFGGKDGAEAVKQQAAKAGYSSVISSAAVGGKTFFRVTVPAGNDRAGAENMAARLKNSGFPVLVVGMN